MSPSFEALTDAVRMKRAPQRPLIVGSIPLWALSRAPSRLSGANVVE
jgi:hypothetical protein